MYCAMCVWVLKSKVSSNFTRLFALRIRDGLINVIVGFIERRTLFLNMRINVKFIIITSEIESDLV